MKTAAYFRYATLSALIGTAAVFALTPGVTSAAGTESFQISPPTANFAGNKGQTVNGTVKVTNLTGQAMTFDVGKQNFVAKGEEGQVELTDNADPLYSLAPWFNFDTTQLTVGPRGTGQLSYTIGIPVDAEPGGRYGSITFSTIPPKLGGQSGASIEQTIGSLIFLRINGAAKEDLQVASFATDKSFYEYGPVKFLTRIKDTGNVHERPAGGIVIKNMFGATVATLPLDQHFVIPNAIRRWHNTWDPKGFVMGHYTATMNAMYAGKMLTATLSFTIIPYKLIGIILLILIILILVIWRGRKRFGRAFRILAGRE
jgi:hypothetical protein